MYAILWHGAGAICLKMNSSTNTAEDGLAAEKSPPRLSRVPAVAWSRSINSPQRENKSALVAASYSTPRYVTVSEPVCVIRVKFLYGCWRSEALSTTAYATDMNCQIWATCSYIVQSNSGWVSYKNVKYKWFTLFSLFFILTVSNSSLEFLVNFIFEFTETLSNENASIPEVSRLTKGTRKSCQVSRWFVRDSNHAPPNEPLL
jgi:hypothetical protein